MATVDTIYTIAGGAWFQNSLNGVAAFMGSSAGESLLAMGTVLSVSVGAVSYIKTRNLLELAKWAGFYVLVIAVLLGIKRDVQVIDLSNPAAIYQVDNVPAGIAVPASIITRVGAGLAQAYDYVFAQADVLSYSKTGMLFGAALAGSATDFTFMDAQEQQMFTDYVRNCVVGDIMLNRKYSWGDLMESQDPYNLIFNPPNSSPSPLRGIYYYNDFMTCYDAARFLQNNGTSINGSQLGPYYKQALQAVHGFTNQVFGSNNNTALFAEMLGDSYNFFHATSMTSTEIIRRNVVINGLRQGLNGFAAESNDTAGLLNVATTTSLAKMRLSQATGASIGAHTLPVMQSVLLGMTIALFPVLVVLALVSSLSFAVLRGYVLTIAYLQMWPLLFSILNNAMNFYLQSRLGGVAVVLSNVDQVQNTYSDIGTTAGWLALSIPFIAWGMVKGLGQVMSQAGSYLGQTMQSSATQSSGQAVDGNWSFNNMQTGNVQGNKWDTNYGHREGQMTTQTDSGATRTLTPSGQNVFDTTGAMSKLPLHLNGAAMTSSSITQQARESEQQAQTSLSGYQSGRSSSWNQLQQFSSQKGNSDSLVQGSDHSTGSNANTGINKMLSATDAVASALNVTHTEAYNYLMDKATRGIVSTGAKVSAGGKLLGVGGEVHAGTEFSGSTGSSHGTSETDTQHMDKRQDKTSQSVQDFKEGLDMVTSSRVSAGGSHTDTVSSNKVEQLAATLSDTQNSYQQYSDSMTRSHEYSEMAAYVQSNSAQINSNFDQQFANYVMQKSGNAEAVLTDTASPEVATQRQNLAKSFVQEKMLPQIEAEYHGHRANLGGSMRGVAQTPGVDNVNDHWNSYTDVTRDHEKQAGIKDDVPQTVKERYVDTQAQLKDDSQVITDGHETVQGVRDSLKTEHKNAVEGHTSGMENEKAVQKSLAGVDNDEMTKMALNSQKKGVTYYGKK